MYIYIQSEAKLWTVGFYDPDGEWQPESDWPTAEKAAMQVAWLNGCDLRVSEPGREDES